MTKDEFTKIAESIADVMDSIRKDVEAGNGALIEADAVALGIGHNIADAFKNDPNFDEGAFNALADLNDPIPSEAFR